MNKDFNKFKRNSKNEKLKTIIGKNNYFPSTILTFPKIRQVKSAQIVLGILFL